MKARAPNCVHYWIINNQDVGTCRKCGEVRDFGAVQGKKDRDLSSKMAELGRAAGRTSGKKRRRAVVEI